MNNSQIKCPNCNETIDVQDILSHQLEEDYNKKLKSEIEKQIEKVLESTINMYGSVKGIAGNAIQTVQALDLSDGLEEKV